MKRGSGNMQKENDKKFKLNHRGTTMITVVVSFALLLVFVTAFYKVQNTSRNMMMNAKDMLVNNRELVKAFYLEETANETVAADVRLTFRGTDGSFYVDATLNKAQKEGLMGTIYYYEIQQEQENQ